jgi:quinol monooxygenase YgiN
MAHRDRCLRDEPGTLQFEVLRPREEETAILVYKVYESDAAFDVHWKGPHVARVRAEAGEMIVKITATRWTLVERQRRRKTDSDVTEHYLRLVERIERREDEKKFLSDEMQNMVETMTEAEAQRVSESLRHGHEIARQTLEAHVRQLHSPLVE